MVVDGMYVTYSRDLEGGIVEMWERVGAGFCRKKYMSELLLMSIGVMCWSPYVR